MAVLLYEDPKLAKYKSELKKARMARGLTQENLAELSGVNIKSIASYEQSPDKLSNASVNTVNKLAQCLGCDIQDILNYETMEDYD